MRTNLQRLNLIALILVLVDICLTANISPTWGPCPELQTASATLINYPSVTNYRTIPGQLISSITTTFAKPFTSKPKIALSITKIQSVNSLVATDFYLLNNGAQTTTKFDLRYIVVSPFNSIIYRYMGIDNTLPFALNPLGNVGFGMGSYSTYASNTMVTTSINYGSLSSGKGYSFPSFATPYSNYKFVHFLTCFNFQGQAQTTTPFPPLVSVSEAITSSTNLDLKITVGEKLRSKYVHVTFIAIDQNAITNNPKYRATYDKLIMDGRAGGEIEIPQGYQNHTLVGVTDFSSDSTGDIYAYQLSFGTISGGRFGIKLQPSPLANAVKNYGVTYFYLQCLTCPNASYYLDVAQSPPLCVDCAIISNCVQCTGPSACTKCATGYQLSGSSCSKIACSDTNCELCSSLAVCVQCDDGYMVSSGSCILASCTDPNCNTCSPPSVCTQCDHANLYYLNSGSCSLCNGVNQFINTTDPAYPCVLCSPTNCITCSSISQCGTCDEANGYFKNASDSLCYACTATVSNCLTCLSFNQCDNCDTGNGYFKNPSDNQCYVCTATVSNCLSCSSFNQCSSCDTANGYFRNPSDNQCYACTATVPNCLSCIAYNQCDSCDTANGYFKNSSDSHCYACTATITNCQTCSAFFVCSDCVSPFVLNSTDVTDSGQCISCPLVGCLVCSDISTCSQCNQVANYGIQPGQTCRLCDTSNQQFVNSTSKMCEFCSIPHCTTCSSLTFCVMCDTNTNYYNVSNGSCQFCDPTLNNFINVSNFYTCDHCTLSQCITCSSLTECSVCNIANNFVLDSSTDLCILCPLSNCLLCLNATSCKTCDQNNQYFLNSATGLCQFYEVQFVQILKEGCNGFIVKVKIIDKVFKVVKNVISILNNGVNIKNVQQEIETDLIIIHAEYNRSIVNESIKLKVSPGQTLSINYNPFIPPLHYSLTDCQSNKNVENLVLSYKVVSYATLLFSLLSCKIVGLELFGVLQLAYFSLSSHSFLNVYLSPLASLKMMNGLNVGVAREEGNVPPSFKNMGVAGNFINNCNIMLFLLLGEVLVAGTVYLITRFIHSPKVQNYSMYFLKQGVITLILFNCFNISFSTGVHWKYAQPTDQYYVLSTVLLVGSLVMMIVGTFAMEFTDQTAYGEFKNKFKNNWPCKIFVLLTVLYRACLGFYCAVKSDDDYSTLFTTGISMAFVLYAIVNLPYTDAYQNYRSCICHVTMLMILFSTNYYRTMKSQTPMEVKAYIYAPAIIELALIGACIGVSVAVLVYEIYQLFSSFASKKVVPELQQSPYKNTRLTQESFVAE